MSIPSALSAPPPPTEAPIVAPQVTPRARRSSAMLHALRRHVVPLSALGVIVAAAALARLLGPAEHGAFDSAFYLDGARHLALGDGYVSAFVEQAGQSTFHPITHWAPGFSLMMTPFIWLGTAPLTAAAIVIGSCYVLGALLLFLLGTSLLGARAWPLSLLVSAMYALQPATRVWLDALLSDLPWATFALLSVWLGLEVMRAAQPSSGLRFVWGLSLCWVVLVRYAGLLFLPSLLGAVVLGMRAHVPFWKRPLLLWPALLPAALGIGLWNLRNKHVADSALGSWQFASSESAQHLARATRAVTLWTTEAQQTAATLGVERPLYWLLIAALISLLPLFVVSVRSRWRELLLIVASAAGYFSALIFTASVTVIAKLSEPRFWIVTWSLTWLAILFVVCGLARVAASLPAPETCKIFANDPRPLMLHRALPPTSTIPLTIAELEAAVQRSGGSSCLVVTEPTKRLRLSVSAERRRRNQNEVIDALKAQKRLKLITRKPSFAVFLLK